MKKIQLRRMFAEMASHGTAPEDGCSWFGAGYEEAFERLKNVYLYDFFNRGDSAEKFVVGPFGSGKTHFLNQLLEMAREAECVTIKVNLNKDIDFTEGQHVYRELVREIRPTSAPTKGLEVLIEAAVARIAAGAVGEVEQLRRLERWAAKYSPSHLSSMNSGRWCSTLWKPT